MEEVVVMVVTATADGGWLIDWSLLLLLWWRKRQWRLWQRWFCVLLRGYLCINKYRFIYGIKGISKTMKRTKLSTVHGQPIPNVIKCWHFIETKAVFVPTRPSLWQIACSVLVCRFSRLIKAVVDRRGCSAGRMSLHGRPYVQLSRHVCRPSHPLS